MPDPAPRSFVLTGGRVWDGLAETTEVRDVAVADGLISDRETHAASPRIDVSGCTVLPGLIEAHVHLCFNGAADWREVYDSDSAERMLLRMAGHAQRMLRAGITTARDLGAPTPLAVAMREAIRGGLVDGPDLLISGAPVTTTGGHCWFMHGEADGPLGVRVAVRERHRAGVDWIKVMASGGNMTPGSNPMRAQYSIEELRACVDEAHRLGHRVTAHAHGVEGIRVAVEAEVDMIEHCSFQGPDGPEPDEDVAREIARRGITVSPTISVGMLRTEGTPRWERRGRVLRTLLDAGARLVMSTDAGIPNVPHGRLGAALAVLQRLTGMPPVEALRLATSTSADLLGLPDRGRIEPHRRADLLVAEGDPLEDLGALERVRLVVAGGRIVHRA